MPTMQEVAAEAICSALYNMPFTKFLGERPDDFGSDVAYFRLSRDPEVDVSARSDPKQVVVAVRKAEEGLVVVQVTWLNLTRGLDHPLRGEKILRVGTIGAEADVRLATEAAVVAVLGVYSDVLAEQGVAGPIDQLAPESEAGDPDDPNDMAVPLSE
jgi:hypothetical protein